MLKEEHYSLPLEHYFITNHGIRNERQKYLWMINSIDKMRDYIALKHKPAII